MKTLLARYGILISILSLALFVRLYKITNPLLDWHSFRQADTASVTREYVKHGIDILHPRYHDLGNIQSGKENPEGYRMVELPLINAAIASLLVLIPSLPLEITSRVISILFSLLSIICLFFLVKPISGSRVAYVSAILFAVLPYSVYYSRTVLPEPALVAFFLFSLMSFQQWLSQRKWLWYLSSLVALSVALLLKPFILFFFPVYGALLYICRKTKWHKEWLIYPFFILAIIPLLWWRSWITQYPSGIPASDWLFNGNGIRFRPAWFRWLAYERVTKLILGGVGVLFLPLSLIGMKSKELWFYLATWGSCLVYVSVIATGNVQHDYYQYLILPIICITAARGIVCAEHWVSKKTNPLISTSIILGTVVLSLIIAWFQVKGYYAINHPEYVTAGKAVDRLTPPDSKVIAPAFGDTMFLYQTNRTGWPIGYHIEEKIAAGATHYISVNDDDEARLLEETYFTIEKTPHYVLIDLTKKQNP